MPFAECSRIQFSGHAVRRLFERQMTEGDIVQVIRRGEALEH